MPGNIYDRPTKSATSVSLDIRGYLRDLIHPSRDESYMQRLASALARARGDGGGGGGGGCALSRISIRVKSNTYDPAARDRGRLDRPYQFPFVGNALNWIIVARTRVRNRVWRARAVFRGRASGEFRFSFPLSSPRAHIIIVRAGEARTYGRACNELRRNYVSLRVVAEGCVRRKRGAKREGIERREGRRAKRETANARKDEKGARDHFTAG